MFCILVLRSGQHWSHVTNNCSNKPSKLFVLQKAGILMHQFTLFSSFVLLFNYIQCNSVRCFLCIPGKRGFLLFFGLFFLSQVSYSQTADTLSLAKQVIVRKQFRKAEELLESYCEKHPGNLNAQWLYGQAAYFARHFKKAQMIYDDAIRRHPENYTLRLDYAKKLVD